MRWSKIVKVWALLLGAMVLNGMFRELFLRPVAGDQVAEKASPILGLMIVLAVTRPFLQSLVPMPSRDLWRIGAWWVGLTVTFEFVFGHFVSGRTWTELVSAYAFWNGELWPLVLLALVVAPFIWAPRRAAVGSAV